MLTITCQKTVRAVFQLLSQMRHPHRLNNLNKLFRQIRNLLWWVVRLRLTFLMSCLTFLRKAAMLYRYFLHLSIGILTLPFDGVPF
jgi:hypothetical protein